MFTLLQSDFVVIAVVTVAVTALVRLCGLFIQFLLMFWCYTDLNWKLFTHSYTKNKVIFSRCVRLDILLHIQIHAMHAIRLQFNSNNTNFLLVFCVSKSIRSKNYYAKKCMAL